MPLKNDWKHEDIVQPEDMNDISNEILNSWSTDTMRRVNTRFPANPANFIYVATTGNDTTGDGTQGAPFASLGKAVAVGNLYTRDSLVRIQLAAGEYSEPGFSIIGAGMIEIVGVGVGNTSVRFTAPAPGRVSAIDLMACSSVTFTSMSLICGFALATSAALIRAYKSSVWINLTNISSSVTQNNAVEAAVFATHGSSVDIANGDISGFHTALYAHVTSAIYTSIRGSALSFAYRAVGGVIYVLASDPPIFGSVVESHSGKVRFSHLQGVNNTIIIHVAPNGDDRNWGQGAAFPVATLARARDIAQRCEGTGVIRIQFADGTYEFSSGAIFSGISRHIEMRGNPGNLSLVNLRFTNPTNVMLGVHHCASITLDGITFTKAVSNIAPCILFWQTKAWLASLDLTAEPEFARISNGINVYLSELTMTGSTVKSISNMNAAVSVNNGASMGAINMSGSGNNVAYQAVSTGTIVYTGTIPGAALLPVQQHAGGIILNNLSSSGGSSLSSDADRAVEDTFEQFPSFMDESLSALEDGPIMFAPDIGDGFPS